MNRWIPCSERLPEKGVDVLLQQDERTFKIAAFEPDEDDVDGWSDGVYWYSLNSFIAWMPLPEPYSENRCGNKTADEVFAECVARKLP